ncbi:MAG: hypothetical protein PHX83_00200 [Acidobacteriia bacterium]|nr:hypothetical protein [Terriglobia bacterium]
MRYLKLLVVFVLSFIFVASFAFAKPEYAKKEGNKACTFCHVKAGSKDLNDMGKCYAKNNHTLDKCK